MTGQDPHTITVHGERWNVCSCDQQAFLDAVPRSPELGFETQTKYTSNWSGRIDHFAVRDGQLVLTTIEANLSDWCSDFVPLQGHRIDRRHREFTTRYAPVIDQTLYDDTTTSLVYDHLPIPYTGELIGGRDLSMALYFHGGIQTPNRYAQRVVLTFDTGRLLSSDYEHGASPDDMNRAQWALLGNSGPSRLSWD